MTDARIIPFPSRPDLSRRVLRARARKVACPACDAAPGRPCTAGRMSPIIRLNGPHPDRIAAAEAETDDHG